MVPLTVADLLGYLSSCHGDELVTIEANLRDGTALGANDLSVTFGQGGSDGLGTEVVISWEPGTEVTTSPTEEVVFLRGEGGSVQAFVSVDHADSAIKLAFGDVGAEAPREVVVSHADARAIADALRTALDRP